MSVFVFLGPTLSREEANELLPATYLPPAAQGDVLRAAKEAPFAIGIVDGYFDRLPAVWHKEILWALSRGIHVFGASSMGALRAAELSPFGMVGVGSIFEAFRAGLLEDDDEVAMVHGDESTGYRASSEAMVNIRATLGAAERSGVLTHDEHERLVLLAKEIFYPERSYELLLARAESQGVSTQSLAALGAFLRHNRVDQKRADAITLLRAMKSCQESATPPPSTTFSFAYTDSWSQAMDWAEAQPPIVHPIGLSADLIAGEVRLSRTHARAAFAAALSRAAATALARKCNVAFGRQPLPDVNRANGGEAVHDDGYAPAPVTEHGLTRQGHQALLERQAFLEWLRSQFHSDLNQHVLDELRANGNFTFFFERARDKQNVLSEQGLDRPTLDDAGLSEQELVRWYFNECLGCPVPQTLESFLREFGVKNIAELKREALREWLYQRRSSHVPRE